ncbi:hypothetical protein K2Q16_02120 [Patescibacteria group bacterium]|nr:hypothetical protein [Patescibacteria group bacterium]
MFNSNNLVWAVYGDDAKVVQGWFTPPPVSRSDDKRHWLNVLADEIEECENFDAIKEVLTDAEKIISDSRGAA